MVVKSQKMGERICPRRKTINLCFGHHVHVNQTSQRVQFNIGSTQFNSLPNDKFADQSNLKSLADDKTDVTEKL